jgi:hypothetical protein
MVAAESKAKVSGFLFMYITRSNSQFEIYLTFDDDNLSTYDVNPIFHET